jgi:choline-sulfatase
MMRSGARRRMRAHARVGVSAVPLLGLVLLLIAGCSKRDSGVLPLASGALEGRDVILVTLDTTRRDHIGCYAGDDPPAATSELDRLCARAIRLDQAIAVAPVTLPAHASMMTGLYPPAHGARYNGERRLGPGPATLAERLGAAGYQSAAFASAFVLDPRFGLARGFDHYDAAVATPASQFSGVVSERSAAQTTDAALAWLERRDPAKPLLLWVHYFDAHAPYLAHGAAPGSDEATRYAAEIGEVDRQLGRLLAAPQLDPDASLVMVLADHGEALGEHGEKSHGLFVYDSTVLIPWLIAAPGLGPGQSAALVSQVDLFPTVLDLLGLASEADGDGRSLLQPARATDETVFVETTLPYFDFRLSALHALRSSTGKFVQAPTPEYYRYPDDPQERDNLVAGGVYPAAALALADALEQRLAAWPGLDEGAPGGNADAATVERLRSLGYLAGSDLGMELADPKDAAPLVVLHQQAADAAAAGQFPQALEFLDQALAQFPTARSSRYLRARLLASSGRHADAEADIREVNSRRPNADSVLLQAQLRILAADYAAAQLLLQEAGRLDPGHGGVIVAEGDIALAQSRDVAAARAAYERALALDPERIGRQARTRLSRLPRE